MQTVLTCALCLKPDVSLSVCLGTHTHKPAMHTNTLKRFYFYYKFMRQPRAWAHFCTLLSLLICVAENYSHLHFLEAHLERMDGPGAKGWKGCQPHTLLCDFWGVLRGEGTQREAVSWPAERASLMCQSAGARRVQRKTLSISFVRYNRLS